MPLCSTSDAAIVRSIMALANNLGLSVIPGGVETTAQQDVLIESGYRGFQGLSYGRSAPLRRCAGGTHCAASDHPSVASEITAQTAASDWLSRPDTQTHTAATGWSVKPLRLREKRSKAWMPVASAARHQSCRLASSTSWFAVPRSQIPWSRSRNW